MTRSLFQQSSTIALLLSCLCLGMAQADDEEAEPAAEAPEVQVEAGAIEVRQGVIINALPGQAPVLNDENQKDAMLQQFVQQFRPLLNRELEFIRVTCDLTKDQRPKIRAAGETSLKEVAKKFADQQQGGRGGLRGLVIGGPVDTAALDPYKIIRDALSEVLEETLTTEQMTRYKDETAKRTDNRKRAVILCVVSRLDGALYLTNEQREKISSALSSRWQDKWSNWMMMVQYDVENFPTIPDGCVVPHLNDEQKSIWRGLQKVEFGYSWGMEQGAAEVDDDWWGGQPKKDDPKKDGPPQARANVIRAIPAFRIVAPEAHED